MESIRLRHRIFYRLFRPLTALFVRIRFGYRWEGAAGLPERYVVLSNHTTDYDMLFVAASFPRPMYFVGSEHIARWEGASRLLRWAFDPILRAKGASGAHAAAEMLRRSRGGANLCLFPEGIRSWDGAPCPISPSTAKLVRRMGCGLVTYRIVGGYFASPMWAGASVRRGYVRGGPVRVFTREQLGAMSDGELYAAICADLAEDAYARQERERHAYRSEHGAEGLEQLLFLCPRCARRDSLRTQGNTVSCAHCGLRFRYDEYGFLPGAPFPTVQAFAAWQRTRVAEDAAGGAVYTAPRAVLSVVRQHAATVVAEGALSLSPAALRCGEVELPLDEITHMAMHGQRALVLTAGDTYYELVPAPGASALQFLLYVQASKGRLAGKVR